MQISEITRDDTLRSTVPYGTAEFPFECYLDQLEHYKSRCVEWHWHSELQFFCVLDGSVTACIGSDRIAMQTGDGLFINSGAIHRFESGGTGRLVNLIFSPGFPAPQGSVLFLKYVAPFLASDCGYLSLRRVREPDRSLLERMEEIDQAARWEDFLRELRIHNLTSLLWQELAEHAIERLSPVPSHGGRLVQIRLQTSMPAMHSASPWRRSRPAPASASARRCGAFIPGYRPRRSSTSMTTA